MGRTEEAPLVELEIVYAPHVQGVQSQQVQLRGREIASVPPFGGSCLRQETLLV